MIRVQNLNYTIGDTQIFSDFNFQAPAGSKILISGRSGLGKTSLFKLIMGFESYKSGSIHINGETMGEAPIHHLRQHLFYLSQDVDFMDGTVDHVLKDIGEFNGILDAATQIPFLLDFLELSSDTLKKKVSKLSGGERQRMGLLVCFMLNRSVWLLDEPTAALDDAMKEKIARKVARSDRTVLVISHDAVWQSQEPFKIERWN